MTQPALRTWWTTSMKSFYLAPIYGASFDTQMNSWFNNVSIIRFITFQRDFQKRAVVRQTARKNTLSTPICIEEHISDPTMRMHRPPLYAVIFHSSNPRFQCRYPLCLTGAAAAASSAWSCLCNRILAASVPSSGVAASLNHGCCKACFAVIRSAGSQMKIFLSRSRKLLQNLLFSGMISFQILAWNSDIKVLTQTYIKPLHRLYKPPGGSCCLWLWVIQLQPFKES